MLLLLPLVLIIIANDIPIFIILLPNLFRQTRSFSMLSLPTYSKYACIMYQTNTSAGLPTVFPEEYSKALLLSVMQQKKQFCFLVYLFCCTHRVLLSTIYIYAGFTTKHEGKTFTSLYYCHFLSFNTVQL